MKLKPLGDRLIVKPVEEEETTASGLVLPETAKEKPQKGTVVAAGDGAIAEDGSRRPLDVSEGEIVVLMGLSGSGKSTLLRGVNGLNKIVRGRILISDEDGKQIDVAKADTATLRHLRTSRTAMVFQQVALLPWRSVLDNVSFGLELSGMPAAKRRDQAMASAISSRS